ncbi:pathogenesis-related protein 1B-like [Salvia hispanica]|uniref:pathogenesis-related protein 1B-like n=1 Tax=Salvia hispanica TaxID=49212 RepID=UPI0020097A29|nr:pathogenesis-related protein 1B-like [Salvia hispanica]
MGSSTISLFLILSFIAATASAQNLQQDFLDAHNRERELVDVKPMTWSTTVADYASNYAQSRSSDCREVYSLGPYGENVAAVSSLDSAENAVGTWVREKPFYDYESNSCMEGQVCWHYTQVVWRESTELGCALQQCDNGLVFAICCYNPRGNITAQLPY